MIKKPTIHLVAALCLGGGLLSACGDDGDNGTTNNGTTNNGTTNNGTTNNGTTNNGTMGECPATCDQMPPACEGPVARTFAEPICNASTRFECRSLVEEMTNCATDNLRCVDGACAPAVCGDGLTEGDETCDGDDCPTTCPDEDNDACTVEGLQDGTTAAECNAVCAVVETITEAVDGDGCCPEGVSGNSDTDCPEFRGAGTACSGNDDCDGPMAGCITMTQSLTFPGGYCVYDCDPATAGSCGDSEICLPQQNGGGVCLAGCSGEDDCRDGYECAQVTNDGATACFPAPTKPTEGQTGEVCTRDEDCDDAEFCATEEGFDFAGGYCTRDCTTDVQCPEGSACSNNGRMNPDGSPQEGNCVDLCDDATDPCRAGYECFIATQEGQACFPVSSGPGQIGDACDDRFSDCAGGQVGRCLTDLLGGYCSLLCANDADCGTGAHCNGATPQQDGRCVLDCATDDDCTRDGYVCDDGNNDAVNECLPGSTGIGRPGAACDTSNDCEGRLSALCLGDIDPSLPAADQDRGVFVDGYCTFDCMTDTDCGAGAHCGFIGTNSVGTCLADCVDDTSCRGSGYVCGNWDNDAAGTNECAPGYNGTVAPAGACTMSSECSGGVLAQCRTEGSSAQGYSGGFCAARCTAAGGECGTEAHCAFIGTNGFGICYENCTGNPAPGGPAECRDGYACLDQDADTTLECFPVASGTGAPGTACTSLLECGGGASGFCRAETTNDMGDALWVGGSCLVDCTNDATLCTAGSHCQAGLFQSISVCIQTCGPTGSACRPDYSCARANAPNDASPFCYPSALVN